MSAPAPPLTARDEEEGERPGFASWYLILVLTLAYTASFIDRQVLNLLVGPLKAEFGLNDTRLSLLQGVAFTGAYILMSPLFGRLADVGSRRGILMFGVLLWSAATSACGLARNYWQLFFCRFGVGGSEACLTPASWSIIADSFPARMIPRAFSIYMMGPYLGGGLALIFGGLLLQRAEHWDLSGVPLLAGLAPWQLVFVMAGLPGLLIAAMLLFVREPVRHEIRTAQRSDKMPLSEVWRVFAERRGFYGNFYVGMACLVIVLYALPAWMPTVLIRRFAATPAEVGVQYGVLILVTGSLGVLTGPWVARLLERRGRTDQLVLIPLCTALALIPATGALAFAPSYGVALALATLGGFIYSLPQALASSALQIVTPNRMRGLASSIYVFAVSVTGLGAAPTIVALITDYVFGDEGRVGESLAITCAGAGIVSSFFLWRCLRSYRLLVERA